MGVGKDKGEVAAQQLQRGEVPNEDVEEGSWGGRVGGWAQHEQRPGGAGSKETGTQESHRAEGGGGPGQVPFYDGETEGKGGGAAAVIQAGGGRWEAGSTGGLDLSGLESRDAEKGEALQRRLLPPCPLTFIPQDLPRAPGTALL